MNRKQAIKELKRIQKVDKEQRERIDKLVKGINEQKGKIAEQHKLINEQQGKINEQQGKINEQQGLIDEQKGKIDEQQKQIDKLDENSKEIIKVQQEQGIDIAALAKALNSLEAKKIVMEDEYAMFEDKLNRLQKIIKENPDLAEDIDLGHIKQGMKNALKSRNFIDERIIKVNALINEIIDFDDFNYNF